MHRNAPRWFSHVFAVLASVFLLAPVMSAQSAVSDAVPNDSSLKLIKYSGTVVDTAGKPLQGVQGISFALYREEDSGAPIWLETQSVTCDEAGRYTVLLGATTSGLPPDLFPSDEQRWLGVRVQGQHEQPRVLLASVPYALKAMEADKLAGRAASEFVTTDMLQTAVRQQLQQQSPGATATVGPPLASNGQTASSGVKAAPTDPATDFVDSTTDQVVLVQQNGTGVGLSATASGNSAIVGTTNASTPPGVVAGVEGVSALNGSYGIYGLATSASSSQPGIGALGQSKSPNGIGLEGIATGTGNTTGLIAQATSTGGFAVNATETATSGSTVGIASQIYSPTGIGVLIFNNSTGNITGSLISARTKAGVQFSVDGRGNANAQGSVTSLGNVTGSRLISSVPTGTPPLQVFSTTQVSNLNASLLGGNPASAFALASGSPGYIQNGAGLQSGANFNIDGSGTLGGTLTANSVKAAAVQVAGPVKISGSGNGLTFPDGSTQQTAPQVTLGSNVFTGTQEAPILLADVSTTIGSTPGTNGQAAIIPDNLDTVHSSIGQAGQNMHFRLSEAQPGPGGGKDFLIAPYTYGMSMEYAGVLEVWVDDFSVHTNQTFSGPNTPARFWVGDESDLGGLFVTAMNNGGGSNSYVDLAADRFTHQSHGTMQFQVRDQEDGYKFQWGPYGSEVTRASILNTATATNLNLMYGSVQGTFTADSNNNGAISIGSVSATPVNLVASNTPLMTVFPDGNVSIGNQGDSARLSVGLSGLFTVNDGGVVTATSLNVTSSLSAATLSANSVNGNSTTLSGTLTSNAINTGVINASAITSGSLTTPTLNASSGVFTLATTNTLNVTTATASTVNSNAETTSSLTLGNGTPIVGHLSVTTSMAFSSIPANSCQTQSASVPGASDGDTVALGIPTALGSVDGVTWFGWVSATDTVSVRGCNAALTASSGPPPVSVRIDVWKH